MANQFCSNCGHDVSMGVNPQSYVADIYHYEEKGMLFKSKRYSKRCTQHKCPCADPKIDAKWSKK